MDKDSTVMPVAIGPVVNGLRRITEVSADDGRHIYVAFVVADERGAVHFHFRIDEERDRFDGSRFTCAGVETHFGTAPDYMRGSPPSQPHCQYLDGKPCWHDGTSLWASEHWIPGFAMNGTGWVWRELERQHAETFGAGDVV